MKQTLKIGAYGWCHAHWSNVFYPEDLPMSGNDDWRLSYYSNEFSSVLVPADYWQRRERDELIIDRAGWLDDVNDDFQFFVECDVSMVTDYTLVEMMQQLKVLQSQLSGLVLLDNKQGVSEIALQKVLNLADELMVDVYADMVVVRESVDRQINSVWRQGCHQFSNVALLEDDLTNLKSVRTIVDDYMSQVNMKENEQFESTIIVRHGALYPEQLKQLRAMTEIMGY